MKRHQHNKRGFALILVLAFLMLVSGIVLSFLSGVSTENTVSEAAVNSMAVQQLANSAVNVVIAQIADATKGVDPANTSSKLCWASQPGMIRTFDTSANLKYAYKLYSSDAMVVEGSKYNITTDVPPDNWNDSSNAGVYVDLNAPVLIRDASGSIQSASTGFLKYSAVYPIVDPFAEGVVDGFSLSKRPGFTGGNTLPTSSYNPTQSIAGKTANPAPMPVKWLYVLRSGKVASPSNASNGTLTIPGASKDDPVVARMAFWTDDETSKININTASEGVYWDVPRVCSPEDLGQYSGSSVAVPGMAICQPAQKEFQRYPGHPATTCLSPVLGKLGLTSENYYDIIPRVVGGGSKGGTAIPTIALQPDQDRLYSSVDEIMFSSKVSGELRTTNPPTSNSTTPGLITQSALSKVRFFLTAASNAPEVTLFNTPRISVWPVWLDSSKRTAYDNLAALCSTIGGSSYYFIRNNPRSATEDYSSRNATLYKYLQALTAEKIPGFGGNFSSKFGSDRDQILTLIYDYIRCTNLSDTSAGAAPYTPKFDAADVTVDSANLFPLGAGEVIPIRIGSTRGCGRILTVSEADILLYATHTNSSGLVDRFKAVFFVQFNSPMQGLAGMRSSLKYSVKGLDQFTVNPNSTGDQPLNLPVSGVNYIEVSDIQTQGGRSVGGHEGPDQAFYAYGGSGTGENVKKLTTSGGTVKGNYPFFSANEVSFTPPASVPFGTDRQLTFKGGTISIELSTQDTGEVVQTLNLTFPDGLFKIPQYPSPASDTDFFSRISVRFSNAFIRGADTVFGVQGAGGKGNATANGTDSTVGDIRMIAPLSTVPTSRFQAHNNYLAGGAIQFAHSTSTSVGDGTWGWTTGKLVNVNYPSGHDNPILPARTGNAVTRVDGEPGDWDTGIGNQPDGAYLNKPDDGDARFKNSDGSARTPYNFGWFQGFAPPGATFFSPNRQIPSPLMFGSIPTGVQQLQPWQTLLFHPRPEDPSHPGKNAPMDHLLADLFWMPVVEPYAISEPFSTSGKINLNYAIAPFTYISRKTGLYGVLKSTKFMAIPTTDGPSYKDYVSPGSSAPNANRRRSIDIATTLQACDTKFNKGEIYKSATEICELNLIPPGETSSSMAAFWNANKLTGDNLREKPYADLYSRLTTKSNTYTVHVCVQLLKKNKLTGDTVFVDPKSTSANKDFVVSEYRGSTTIERYISGNQTLPDMAMLFANNPNNSALNMSQYYKFRILNTRKFTP